MTTETRYMRNALWDNKTYPSSYNIISGSLYSGSLTNLQASDDVYMVFQSSQVGADQVIEVVFIGSISGHVPFVQIRYESHESITTVLVEVTVYNYYTGSYETTGTMYYSRAGSTSDITRYLYHLLGNKGVYVNANGEWKVKVKAVRSNSTSPFYLYIDYLHFRSVCFQLGTTQTTTYISNNLYVDGLTVGIRVWGIKSDDTEEEITNGTLVATVTGPSATVTLSATWNCPQTQTYVAYLIIVYRIADPMRNSDLESGGLPFVFMTEDLNASLLNATWTVYYAFYYSSAADATFFRFGTTTYNSRIANFTWGVPPPPAVIKKFARLGANINVQPHAIILVKRNGSIIAYRKPHIPFKPEKPIQPEVS